jgi:hypothetical protein
VVQWYQCPTRCRPIHADPLEPPDSPLPGASNSGDRFYKTFVPLAKKHFKGVRIPMKPAIDSETKPATCSDFIPASIPI